VGEGEAGLLSTPPAAPSAASKTAQPLSLASWTERHQRAMKLLARHPESAPLLEFLIDLLEQQREVYRWAPGAVPLATTLAGDDEYPRLQLTALPFEALAPRFAEFVKAVGAFATEVLAGIGARLGALDAPSRAALLRAYASRAPLDDLAATLDCDPRQAEFYPRAFLQPVAEALAAPLGEPPEHWHETFCPHCGFAPQVALLRDDALIKSRRLLECLLCRTQWPFRRAVCPHCGESKSDQLEFHEPEGFPHVRVEECHTCRAYFKTVDLRKNGLAVPVIEELASPELDLWADEKGLWKLQPNLLGL
jgi:FdhE protein